MNKALAVDWLVMRTTREDYWSRAHAACCSG